MKAEELMIGDLVYYCYANLFVTKVIDVCSHGEEHFIRCKRDEKDIYKQDQLEDFHVGILRPIPLTPEILKKNGFKLNEAVEDYYCIYNGIDGRVSLCNDKEYMNTNNAWDVHIDSENYCTIANCELTYLHELQHILRLCKIDKEIII